MTFCRSAKLSMLLLLSVALAPIAVEGRHTLSHLHEADHHRTALVAASHDHQTVMVEPGDGSLAHPHADIGLGVTSRGASLQVCVDLPLSPVNLQTRAFERIVPRARRSTEATGPPADKPPLPSRAPPATRP